MDPIRDLRWDCNVALLLQLKVVTGNGLKALLGKKCVHREVQFFTNMIMSQRHSIMTTMLDNNMVHRGMLTPLASTEKRLSNGSFVKQQPSTGIQRNTERC